VSDYRKLINDLKLKIADVAKKQTELASERKALEVALSSLKGLAGRPLVGARPQATETVIPRFHKCTMAEAITTVVAEADGPLTTAEISELLRAGGLNSDAPSFTRMVYNALEAVQSLRAGRIEVAAP